MNVMPRTLNSSLVNLQSFFISMTKLLLSWILFKFFQALLFSHQSVWDIILHFIEQIEFPFIFMFVCFSLSSLKFSCPNIFRHFKLFNPVLKFLQMDLIGFKTHNLNNYVMRTNNLTPDLIIRNVSKYWGVRTSRRHTA